MQSVVVSLVLLVAPSLAGQDSWLSIRESDRAVEELRLKARNLRKASYEAIFAALRDGWSSTERLEQLRQNRARAVRRLHSYLEKDAIDSEGVSASFYLWALGDPSVSPWLVKAMRDSRPAMRRRIVGGLSSWTDAASKRRLAADEQLVSALLAQLDTSDARLLRAAIQACGSLELPGMQPKFVAMLERDDIPARSRSRILYWLGEGDLSEEVLDVVLKQSKRLAPSEGWQLHALARYAKHQDVKLRRRAVGGLRDAIDRWQDDGSRGFQGARLKALRGLRDGCSKRDLPWLRKAVARERGAYRAILLAGLLRISPAEGMQRLTKDLQDPDAARSSSALYAVEDALRGSADAKLVALIAKARAEPVDLATALLAVGGPGFACCPQASVAAATSLDASTYSKGT